MLKNAVAKWTSFNLAPRGVAIPLDRPDLLADAGYDGLRYVGDRSSAAGQRVATWWMPFHAAAG